MSKRLPLCPPFYNLARTAILSVCLALLGATFASGEDWPHWRGLGRNGNVNEPSHWRGAKEKWPPRRPLWRAKVGMGGSGPIVIGQRLYTIGWTSNRDEVVCLDVKTGRQLWKQSYPCPRYGRHSTGDKGLYGGPSACPSFDPKNGRLFTLSTDGDLICWDTRKQGQRVWGFNLYDKYKVGQRPKIGRRSLRDYGYTTAPLLHGSAVIVEVGDDEGNLMAFSQTSGRRLWTSQSKDPAGHTGGVVPISVAGVPCVTVLTIRNLLVARVDGKRAGKTLAEFPWATDFANNVATPTVLKNSIIVTSEYNHYAISRIDVSMQGAKQVWRKPYASGLCPPVIHKGHVYWCWRGVYCLDFATGKPIWRGGRNFGDTGSCITTSDDRIIVWGRRGDLALVETAARSPRKYKELARKRGVFETDVWPHIVLAGGRLYCKDRDGNMKCFALSLSQVPGGGAK